MSISPADHAGTPPGEGSEQQEPDVSARPELRVVPPVGSTATGPDTSDTEADTEGVADDGIAPEAPWQYQLGEQVAAFADALPGLWSNRQPSYSERVQYSLSGDWTTTDEGQGTKRSLHLVGIIACLAVDGLLVTPLRAATAKPSRLGLLLLVVLLLAYAL